MVDRAWTGGGRRPRCWRERAKPDRQQASRASRPQPTGLAGQPATCGMSPSLCPERHRVRCVVRLLDNARDAGQVRPLLPGSPGCLVIVTSRSQLTGLVAAEGARPLTLDVLSEDEARDLLSTRLGLDRLDHEPGAVRELAALCAGLPLALVIVAARAAVRPRHALTDLVAELRDAQSRLDALDTGDPATSLRAVFSWSCQQLGDPAARMFRLLGLMAEGGGTDVDADNEAVRESCAASGGRLVPFFFANPHRGAGAYERQGRDYRGLKLAPVVHGIALDDRRTGELAAVAERFGHPVYLHCLGRPGYTVPDLVALARRHPDVSFILGHGGVGDLDLYGIGLIAPEPNILFETSGGYSFVIQAAVRRLGPLRVLFGTEYPLQHPGVELTKYRVLNLPDSVWEEIGWNNMARLTGEPLR